MISKISSTETPDFRASKTVNIRKSSTLARRSWMGAPSIALRFRVFMWISAPRTAFSTAISKLVPMDMTSPVAFIWVPSLRSAFGNLSKGHFGNLTTM